MIGSEFLRPADRLYFIRIPKTASNSWLALLRDAYPYWRQCPYFASWHIPLMERSHLTSRRCFHGHWGVGFLRLLPEPTHHITILRDPIEQVVSWFLFMKKPISRFPGIFRDELNLWQPVLEGDLEAALDSPYLLAYMSNMQTKFLGVEIDLGSWIGTGPAGINGVRKAFHQAFANAEPQLILPQAIDVLQKCSVIGLCERFAESAGKIAGFVGLPRSRHLPSRNIGPSKSSVEPLFYRARISPTLVNRLERITEYDRELYRIAEGLFDQRLETSPPGVPSGLRIPALANLALNRVSRSLWHRVGPLVGQDSAERLRGSLLREYRRAPSSLWWGTPADTNRKRSRKPILPGG